MNNQSTLKTASQLFAIVPAFALRNRLDELSQRPWDHSYQLGPLSGNVGPVPIWVILVLAAVAVIIIVALIQNKRTRTLAQMRKKEDDQAQTQTKQIYCTFCGSKIPPTSIFCDVCGHAQQQPTSRPIRINSLLGMTTTDSTGKVVGAVSDVELSDGRTYLVIRPIQAPGAKPQEGATDMIVRWDQITSIQDIIILKTQSKSKLQICACGYENPPAAKFCRNCGRVLD